MFVQIAGLLSAQEVDLFQQRLAGAGWVDGRATAGHLSARVKHNTQLAETDPIAAELGSLILDRLEANATFLSAALPLKIAPPLFNRHSGGERYGRHIDGAVRPAPRSDVRIRTDLSATLFLSDPDSYTGGELVIEEGAGTSRSFKLPAGSVLLYPATRIHRVDAVSAGTRLAAFFWIQSMVRNPSRREMLYALDATILRLTMDHPDDSAILELTALYHNLVREWAHV